MEVKEPQLPPTVTEIAAVDELVRLRPEILEAARRHAARIAPPEVPTPRMTPSEVQAEIDRACGRTKPKLTTEPAVKPPEPVQPVSRPRVTSQDIQDRILGKQETA
jgi:hypothetical protein